MSKSFSLPPSDGARAASTPAERVRLVIAQTQSAWCIAPTSAREVARRAPHGYVPVRVVRRIRAAAQAVNRPLFAHSW